MTFKTGKGIKENSSNWTVVFDDEKNIYYGDIYLGNAEGILYSLYEINKDIYDLAGTFDNDDYKTQNLIKKGKLLYDLEDTIYSNGPQIEIIDDNYRYIIDTYFKYAIK